MHNKLREQLRRHEGLELKPYKDTAGKSTIGIGRNLDDRGITEAEAFFLLENDVNVARAALDHSLGWTANLDKVRQAVLLNMTFNMGINGLLGFVNTLAAIKRGDYEAAAQGMLASKWAGQVKGRAVELAEQMRTGKWQF